MAARKSAIRALKKLEADRQALDEKQTQLEEQAAHEVGVLLLGTGVEEFSKTGLKTCALALGRLGEEDALNLLAGKPSPAPSTSAN